MESKSGDDGDGDGVQPVVVSQRSCRVETMPASFWFKVVMFLAWSDASALHATSKAVRDHTVGKWSPRLTVAAERAALAVVASGTIAGRSSVGRCEPVGVKTSRRTRHDAALSCSESSCPVRALAVVTSSAILCFVRCS